MREPRRRVARLHNGEVAGRHERVIASQVKEIDLRQVAVGKDRLALKLKTHLILSKRSGAGGLRTRAAVHGVGCFASGPRQHDQMVGCSGKKWIGLDAEQAVIQGGGERFLKVGKRGAVGSANGHFEAGNSRFRSPW